MAAECALEVRSEKGGTRTVKMDGGFYTGYRRNVLAPDEILVSVSVPYTEEDEHFVAFKQAKRRDDDIAIVNSAFFFKLSGSGGIEVNDRSFVPPALNPLLTSRPDGILDGRVANCHPHRTLVNYYSYFYNPVSGVTFTTCTTMI